MTETLLQTNQHQTIQVNPQNAGKNYLRRLAVSVGNTTHLSSIIQASIMHICTILAETLTWGTENHTVNSGGQIQNQLILDHHKHSPFKSCYLTEDYKLFILNNLVLSYV